MFGFFKKKPQNEPFKDNIASLKTNDSTLPGFKQKAQEELDYLIDFMRKNGSDDQLFQYAVKTNFIEKGSSEHMWVQVYNFNDGSFVGKLANKPHTIKLFKYADDVKVRREDVEDWILNDLLTCTKVGGFSSGYIREKSKES